MKEIFVILQDDSIKSTGIGRMIKAYKTKPMAEAYKKIRESNGAIGLNVYTYVKRDENYGKVCKYLYSDWCHCPKYDQEKCNFYHDNYNCEDFEE